MRFDDMLATCLAWEPVAPDATVRQFLQLTDLLARRLHVDGDAVVDAAYARLRAARATVPAGVMRRVAERLGKRRLSPALVLFFAEDADVARPLLATVALDAAEWERILPVLSPVARAIVAARHDLPPRVAMLPEDGEAPLLAKAPPVAIRSMPAGGDQIKDLLARIDAYTAVKTVPAEEGFAFAIDAAGIFLLDDGGRLDAHIGSDPHGVDGQAIGAWRAGAAFTDARLLVSEGRHAGEWRISAAPLPGGEGHARFRGEARRPRPDETAESSVAVSLAPPPCDPRLERAIDGLRAPLADIAAAGSLTETADGEIATAAADVVGQGLELIDAIERFDLARAAAAGDAPLLDAAIVLGQLHAALSPMAEARGITLTFRIARDLPALDVDAQAIERMFSRLIGAASGLARKGERVVARLGIDRLERGRVALTLTRPGRLIGRPAPLLRDPPEGDAGPEASLMAFGFALRLVDRLAAEAGGALTIHDDRFRLSLPCRREAGERRQG